MGLLAHITPLEILVVVAVYAFGAVTGWLAARGPKRSRAEQLRRKHR